MSGPYIPKHIIQNLKLYEEKLDYAKATGRKILIEKYEKTINALNEQITNRENVYYNREVIEQ